MLHIYTGNGKGKTTASAGLALRAAGAGLSVCFVQFLKNGSSSEIEPLKKLGVRVMCAENCRKFTFQMTPDELDDLIEDHNALLRDAGRLIIKKRIQLLVLDEFIKAYNSELFDRILALRVLDDAEKNGCEVVLTGRNAPPELLARADYITEMQAVRHPYENGVTARKGIEF